MKNNDSFAQTFIPLIERKYNQGKIGLSIDDMFDQEIFAVY